DYAERAEPLYQRAVRVAEAASPRDDETVARIQLVYERFQIELLARTDPKKAGERARASLRTAPPEMRDMFLGFVLRAAELKGPSAVEALAKELLADKTTPTELVVSFAVMCNAPFADPLVEIALYRRALEGISDDRYSAGFFTNIQLRLADAYERTGCTADAVAVLTSIDPKLDRGSVSATLGRVYRSAGDAAEAYDAFTRAAALDPSSESHAALVEAAKAAHKTETQAEADVLAMRASMAYPAPEFSLRALDGREVSLAALRGKVVVLNFWFPGCGPCRM